MKDNKAIQSRQNVIGEKGGCCCGGETRGQPGTARESSATVESPAATASSAESELVAKMLDIMVYVSVYFTSVVILFAAIDWRLAIPMLVWLAIYMLGKGRFTG